MANTYSLISSNVLSASAASVTFSAIPSTYTDLVLRISARTTRSATYDFVTFRLNADTATNYSYTYLVGTSTIADTSSGSSSTRLFDPYVNADTATNNTFGSAEIYIPSYVASQNKPISFFSVTENNASTNLSALVQTTAGLWRNTSAVNEIAMTAGVGSFVSGSSFYLYGIKNS